MAGSLINANDFVQGSDGTPSFIHADSAWTLKCLIHPHAIEAHVWIPERK
jgi:hypothetical protein